MSVRWRLVYADGSVRDENRDEPGLDSIRHAPRGALALHLIASDDHCLAVIDLSGSDRGRTMPFAYRHRARRADGRGGTWDVDLVVGRAHPTKGEATVWLWTAEGLVSCPPELIEANTIELFL